MRILLKLFRKNRGGFFPDTVYVSSVHACIIVHTGCHTHTILLVLSTNPGCDVIDDVVLCD